MLATAPPAAAQWATGYAEVDVDVETDVPLIMLPGTTMSTCVHLDLFGTPVSAQHVDGDGVVDPPAACTITLGGAPFGALGPLPGQGVGPRAIFPDQDLFSDLVDPLLDNYSEAVIYSAQDDPTDPLYRWTTTWADVEVEDRGIAAAQTLQTWRFTPAADSDLFLFIDLWDVYLDVYRDFWDLADARVEIFGGFGEGDTPGLGELVSWSYIQALTDDDFLFDDLVLADGIFSLEQGKNYWLTTSVATGVYLGPTPAPNSTVPEPATMLLLGSGLAGVAGAARRRAHRGAGREG